MSLLAHPHCMKPKSPHNNYTDQTIKLIIDSTCFNLNCAFAGLIIMRKLPVTWHAASLHSMGSYLTPIKEKWHHIININNNTAPYPSFSCPKRTSDLWIHCDFKVCTFFSPRILLFLLRLMADQNGELYLSDGSNEDKKEDRGGIDVEDDGKVEGNLQWSQPRHWPESYRYAFFLLLITWSFHV